MTETQTDSVYRLVNSAVRYEQGISVSDYVWNSTSLSQ